MILLFCFGWYCSIAVLVRYSSSKILVQFFGLFFRTCLAMFFRFVFQFRFVPLRCPLSPLQSDFSVLHSLASRSVSSLSRVPLVFPSVSFFHSVFDRFFSLGCFRTNCLLFCFCLLYRTPISLPIFASISNYISLATDCYCKIELMFRNFLKFPKALKQSIL